jgi:tetratricopeptide (TPR) repeat protein
MSVSAEAVQLKADGNSAWASGNYLSAIESFGKAIEKDTTKDSEFLKVLYSNRSAAYLKLGHNKEALDDAEQCIKLDQKWSKGYARKGDALLAAKNATQAYNAYNTGLRMTPGDKVLVEKLEVAMRNMRNASESTSSSGANGGSVVITGISGKIQQFCNSFSLVLVFMYLIPFTGSLGPICYR